MQQTNLYNNQRREEGQAGPQSVSWLVMKTKHAQAEEILIIIFNILISYLGPVLVHTFISKIIRKCRRGSQVASDGNDNDLIKLLRTANILGAVISCLHDNSDQNSGLAPVLYFKASWTCLVLDLCPLWPSVHLVVSSIFYRGARPLANSWGDTWGVRSQKDFYSPASHQSQQFRTCLKSLMSSKSMWRGECGTLFSAFRSLEKCDTKYVCVVLTHE